MSDDANRTGLVPEDSLSAAWRRLKDHRIAQWTVGYVAVAYGIQHAVTLTSEALDWPHAVTRISILLLALGLPVAMTLAWYHGERVSRRISAGELSILSVLLVIASLLFYTLVRPSTEARTASAPVVQETGITAARTAAASPKGAVSVAVLPFLNLSSDKEQEFFSDGMTEEITTALAKVPDLRVVGRTSAFQFKGQNKDLTAIGQALHATHLIEGSVRKAGNRVRITAQLIKADDGTHVWAEDYDRDLTDVFAIQEDIARAITASLHMTLGLKPGENLVNNRNIDPAAYTEYLRIRAAVTASNSREVRQQALRQLEDLVVRQPVFAPAWAYLARIRYTTNMLPLGWRVFTRAPEETSRLARPIVAKSEAAAREAIRLDSKQAYAYDTLAVIAVGNRDWQGAADLLKQALELDPDNADILADNARFGWATGHVSEALNLIRQVQSLEPLASEYAQGVAVGLLSLGRADEAVAALEARPPTRAVEHAVLAEAYAGTGRFDKAAMQVSLVSRDLFGDGGASVDATVAFLKALADKKPPAKNLSLNPFLVWAQNYAGTPQRVLDLPERALASGMLARVSAFDAALVPVRKTPRFKKFLRDAGLVDYWRARGWPELCQPTTGDDFECS